METDAEILKKESRKEDMKAWVLRWKKLGPILEKIRREDIRKESTIKSFDDIHNGMEFILKRYPAKKTSGFVEMQKFFLKHPSYESARRART